MYTYELSPMPSKPAHPCNQPGCGALILEGSKCEKHKKESAKGYDLYRGSRQSRGYDTTWDKIRLQVLKRDDYLCQHCLKNDGRMVPAEHVDHIVRFTSNADPLRTDLTNLQSLCRPCHSRKTVKEDGGLGHARKAI
jgi:5-methylcytosine-specific restriction enzyme A